MIEWIGIVTVEIIKIVELKFWCNFNVLIKIDIITSPFYAYK